MHYKDSVEGPDGNFVMDLWTYEQKWLYLNQLCIISTNILDKSNSQIARLEGKIY